MQTDRVHFSEYDTRLAAYAVIVNDDQMLMTWYNGATPQWTLPGGGVEFEESIEDAVVREVFEETGFEVQVGAPLTTWSFTGYEDPRPYKSVRIVFSATIAGGTLGTVERHGTTDLARWMPLADISTLEPRAEVVDVAMRALREIDRLRVPDSSD